MVALVLCAVVLTAIVATTVVSAADTGRAGAQHPNTRQEVARKGGLAVSRSKQHAAEIGHKGEQSISKLRSRIDLDI